jgi:kynurenine formamidase
MSRSAWVITILSMMLLSGCQSRAKIDDQKLIDLTHPFDDQTMVWPTNRPFHWEKTAWGMTAGGYWYASGDFSMSEHGGTHMDAPLHFAEGRSSVDQIPVSRLVGPAVVIDVTKAASQTSDYRLTVTDLKEWESRHGHIPKGAIVLMRSGWGRYWGDREKYFGSHTPQDAKSLHFPGFSKEAAEFLVLDREINGIGIDTASIDYGPSQDFIVHQIINGADKYGLENIAHVERLPPTGTTLIALPIKIKGGTGGPVRIVAVLH